MPEDVPIVATLEVLLLHVPPPGALERVAVVPGQIEDGPAMATGIEFTVITLVT